MKTQMAKPIDKRNKEDILHTLNKLAASYIPEWRHDSGNPDIASTLGYVYAEQVAENIDRINNILDRYHTEFVNLLDISVRPAKPAQSIVVMGLAQDTIDGVEVLAGTKLAVSGDDATAVGEDTIFETKYNTYITGAQITKSFMTDFESGTIVPLLGEINVPQILNGAPAEDSETDINFELDTDTQSQISDELQNSKSEFKPFVLFGELRGIQSNALLFYHTYMFNNDGSNIYVKMTGANSLVDDIESGVKRFYYATGGTLKEVELVRHIEDDIFLLRMEKEQDLQEIDGVTAHLIALVDSGNVVEKYHVDSIQFLAKGKKIGAEFVGNGVTDLRTEDFYPFTEYLSLYQECYIGHNNYFSKAGAKVTLHFDLIFDESKQNLTPEEEEEELKVIKRKPRDIVNTAPAEVYAQEISIEYFNGVGYMKLPCDTDIRYIFAEGKPYECELSFICPEDWEEATVGGYEGRTLRLQLLKADNCYMRPSVHFAPRIRNLTVEFSYAEFSNPQRMISIYGTNKVDLTVNVTRGEKLLAFRPTGYEQDALYLGLNKRPAKGPVSIFFRLEDMAKYEPLDVVFEYSTREGFKRLRVIDDTYSMSRSGLVTFMPPVDFFDVEIEKSRLFWIRVIRKQKQAETENSNVLPHIVDICMNGVTVQNIDTRPEEQFYLEEVTPYARFDLTQEGILRADVWVNEIDTMTEAKINALVESMPDRVRIEKDINDNVTACYVKWTEVERLDSATDRRVYVLDRLSKEIIFGDGITTDIPRTISDVALRVVPYISKGDLGNVAPGMIDTPMSAMYFIGDMYNPIKGYGGSNMESVEDAMVRGANIISGRRHLVSIKDYEREILAYSDLIDQVKIISGYDAEGLESPGALTFLLLLKDYREGSYSIHQMESDLKKYLLNSCELTVQEDKISVTEPTFVEISVIAWVKAANMQDSFDISTSLERAIDDYIEPLKSSIKSWNIGDIPSTSQLLMWINSFKKDATVQNVAILAKYQDHYGTHEVHLDELEITPFMIGVPGKHQIHIVV